MPVSRRQALEILSATFAMPLLRWPGHADDPLAGTIVDYQVGRVRGDWSAEEVARVALQRCRDWNARLRAVDLLDEEVALAAARASDARARGQTLMGPLDGVPVFAKSIYDMAGLPTTASSAAWARLFPGAVRRDAIEVTRLRDAGAVLLGKTVADDFAYRGNGTSSLSGQVANPYDRTGTRTPGGSSAGSAVAVATGMAFAALGTDDGGSNRIPAQFSGVVGVKPTFGLVPRTGVIPTWPFLDTHGPLARHVMDAALILEAIAKPEADDRLALTGHDEFGFVPTVERNALSGARLGVVGLHLPREQMSAESLAAWDRAVSDLWSAGAIVEPFDPSVTRATVGHLFSEAAEARGDVVPDSRSPSATANALFEYFARHDGDPRALVRRGLAPYREFYDVLPVDWDEMARIIEQPYERDPAGLSFARSREEVTARLAGELRAQRFDAMIYPTMPFPAPRAVDPWPDVRTPLGFGNWLGIPEVSVPSGLSSDGMPAGNISFVGMPGDDLRILALAHSYEQVSGRFELATVPG